jgi:type I restriction enzyme S subunit
MDKLDKTIPKGWEVKKFRDLLDYERPDEYIVKSTDYSESVGTPVLTANKSFVLGYTDENFGIYKDVPAIIFDDFTTDSKYVDFPFKIKSSAIKILKNKDQNSDLKFLYEKIKSIKFPVSNHQRYYISQYQELEIVLPKKDEQRKIVEILESVDSEIEKTDHVIAATEKLKKGLMQQLFTRGIGHTKFKKTEIGEIPEEWEIFKLGSFCDIKGGKRLSKGELLSNEKTSHPYIRVSDFENMSVDQSNIKFLSEESYKKISRYIISRDDIYISIAGTIGLIGFIPDDLDQANLTENAAKIVIKEKFDKKYLGYFLCSSLGQYQIKSLTIQTTQPKLALNKIEQIMVPHGSVGEQREISKIFSSVDEKISVNRRLKEKLSLLKKGLMQDLLSGKVRIQS